MAADQPREPLDVGPPEMRASLLPPSPRAGRKRVAFNSLLLLAAALTLYVVWPFRAPLFLAAVLASVLHGLFARGRRAFGGRAIPAALATTLGLVVVIIGPLAAIVAFAAQEVIKGLAFVHDQLGISSVSELRPGSLPPRGEVLLDHGLRVLHVSRQQLQDGLQRASAAAEHAASAVLTSSWRAVFHSAILVVAFYFFLLEGARLVGWLRRVSPLEARQTSDLVEEFRRVSRASILGSVLAALFQGITATAGFALFRVPHAIFFGLFLLIASFIPVVGTLLVWVPAVAFLWLAGRHGASIGLLAWCLVLVLGGEHVGKPFALRVILRGEGNMHTGLVFLALLGGLEMFGLLGLVLGPLVFAFLLAMLRLYERDVLRPTASIH